MTDIEGDKMNISYIANGRYLLSTFDGYTIRYDNTKKCYAVYRNGILILDNIPSQRKARNVIRNHVTGKISISGRE